MFCPNCGKSAKGGKFCIACGAPLEGSPAGKNPPETVSSPAKAPEGRPGSGAGSRQNPAEKNGNTPLIILIVVLALAIIGVAAGTIVYLLRSGSANEQNLDEDEEDFDDEDSEEDTDEDSDGDFDGDSDEDSGADGDASDVGEDSAAGESASAEDGDVRVLTDYALGLDLLPDQGFDIEVEINKTYGYAAYANDSIGEGPMAWTVRDFDGNGSQELLVVSATADRNLIFEMLGTDGEKVESLARYEAKEDWPAYFGDSASGWGDVFVFDSSAGAPVIGVERTVLEDVTGDGLEFTLLTLDYDEGFHVVGSADCAGSDLSEVEQHFMDDIEKAGIENADWDDLTSRKKAFSDYTEDPEYLLLNVMDEQLDYDEYFDWLEAAAAGDRFREGEHVIRTSDHMSGREYASAGKSMDSFREETVVNQSAEEDEGFVFPDSDRRYLEESELEGLSKEECSLARNEMYARHGRKFNSAELTEYFSQFDWYDPRIEPEDFVDVACFNKYEIYNRDLIAKYEKKKGYK